jgi:hypothetical protein
MFGSVTGVKISMCIEKWLHIGSDDHIKSKVDIVELEKRIRQLECLRVESDEEIGNG